jgi:signal transduction histidine kinase
MNTDQGLRFSQRALNERVKELFCLQRIAHVAVKPDKPLTAILQQIVRMLPPAWQYPKNASARIRLDGRSFTTPGFQESCWKQTAPIMIFGSSRGTVELFYIGKTPVLDKSPFLKEEQKLIDAVARQVALIVERKQAQEDKSKLNHQLLHADRLASIGMLAAGAAHELNEPIGNILGFVQLVQKCPGLPRSAKRDLKKIESASLQAREIIRNLLVFARQTTPTKTRVDLNRIVEEGLLFLEARCIKQGIELLRRLSPDLPEITADPAQLNQVLVNLVLNALQAIDGDGRITVQTQRHGKVILLVVEDTGCGMTDQVIEQIFVPFFTTKEVGQGTGLGLPVVHGIVSSHGGTIKVDSQLGRGTRFEIALPSGSPPLATRNG